MASVIAPRPAAAAVLPSCFIRVQTRLALTTRNEMRPRSKDGDTRIRNRAPNVNKRLTRETLLTIKAYPGSDLPRIDTSTSYFLLPPDTKEVQTELHRGARAAGTRWSAVPTPAATPEKRR